MDWQIGLARQPEKFLAQHHLATGTAVELVLKALRKFHGEAVALDIKPLTGKRWGHCFRIRTSKYRLIFSIDFDRHCVLIEVFDNRDSAYR